MSDINEQEREDLIAFLDGELDESKSREVEARLSLDTAFRSEADSLKQTWGLLDYLPQPEAPVDFTHRTLEKLSLQQMRSSLMAEPKRRRWLPRLAWAAAVLLSAAAGFGLAAFLWLPRADPAEEQHKEWLKRQPGTVRQEINKLKGSAQRTRIEEVRTQERQRRKEWSIASRFWEELGRKNALPVQLADFPMEVQTYVTDYLLPRLNEAEKSQLQSAEGHWPRYPQTLVELADKHPIAFAEPHWPRSAMDLTRDFERRLKLRPGTQLPRPLQVAEGRSSTEFVQAILSLAHKRSNNVQLLPGLWPIEHQDLTPEMQQFVDKVLLPALDIDEKIRYDHACRNWPEYPQTINELAAKHNLAVPWPNLPGSAKFWDKYR